MIISYNSSYEEVEEFILNHNNSLVCNDLGELFLLKDYLWLVSQQTQHKYLLSEVLFIRTATGISKINRSGFLSTYYTISEEKVFQIQ